ncbi:MAG: Bifunctional oligoribonuclease and PAP phosphatase NrnA [bacterium ADurb.Bin429]|nr:MAG: Bifunctional oligoribonuclease and PAP phosphatase NrnA [bacterium ADurb.Bin429]
MSRPDARRVADTLLHYPACFIATHVNPEGDAIGSMLALALALESLGKEVVCYDRHGVPENCRFLPTWERVVTELPASVPPLVVYVDADRLERCDLSVDHFPHAETFARIDHHTSSAPDPGPALVDTKAAAAGELIFELLPLLDVTLTTDIATCLQTALMVDTGRFSYTNTTPKTHRIAADLLAAGADVPAIVDWIWGSVKFEATRLLGAALSTLQRSADDRIAWAVLRNEDFLSVNATPEDTEGIIDAVRAVRGVEVAALFSEKRGTIRVSLRSRGHVDVAALARQFDGGGHVKAAGLTFDGTMENAICAVIGAIGAALEDQP